MSDPAILLTPILVLLILALFRFTGCKPFSSAPADPVPSSPPAPPPTYQEVIAATSGFAALWPFNETGGNQAIVVGPLAPAANGEYKPAGAGAPKIGQQPGVLSKPTDKTKDSAPELDGVDDYIEVPFHPLLNTNASFSVELWAKPNPDAGNQEQVLISSHKIDSTTKRGYEIALVKKTGEPHQQVRARVFSTGAALTAGEVTVQPNQGNKTDWRHIVMTYQVAAGGNKLTLYVRVAGFINPFKGGPAAAVYENVLGSNATSLRFGAGHQQGPNPRDFYVGLIDNVAFYNAALSEADIENHFKQL
jgi:hypothetical protein